MTEPRYETQQASHAVALLCKLFVEKTIREQQEIIVAANSSEPTRQQEGWQLNLERGCWTKPVTEPPPSPIVSSDIPKEV